MFYTIYANLAIDTFQDVKKQIVDQFVTHDKTNKTLKEFVDTQTKYTKETVANFNTVSTSLMSLAMDKSFYADAIEKFKFPNQK
jgi:hypothetical protein